jgi:hypothetical protein
VKAARVQIWHRVEYMSVSLCFLQFLVSLVQYSSLGCTSSALTTGSGVQECFSMISASFGFFWNLQVPQWVKCSSEGCTSSALPPS